MKQSAFLRDPTAETASDLRTRQSPLDTFNGKIVALMDIGKMRGDEFIDRLKALCKQRESLRAATRNRPIPASRRRK
jgi:hypothetical protein